MKTTVITAGIVLLILSLSFALVRLDLVDAEYLRFLPSLLAAIVAVAIILRVLRGKRSVTGDGRMPEKKE